MVSSPQQIQPYSDGGAPVTGASPPMTAAQQFQAMPQMIAQRAAVANQFKDQQLAATGRVNPFDMIRVAAQGNRPNVAQALMRGGQ